jgi:cardiolipin synthase
MMNALKIINTLRSKNPSLAVFYLTKIFPTLIIWFIAKSQLTTAFWIFFAVCASDWLDGYLARLWNATSRLGQILDPLADKFLLVSLYLFLGLWGFVPLWLTALVFIRDFLILAIGGTMILSQKGISLPAQFMGKISTTFQMMLIGWVLGAGSSVASFPTSSIQNRLMVFFLYVVALTTMLSGLAYAKVAFGASREP